MTETPKCPYCGAETHLNENNEGIYWYECRECNAPGPTKKTPEEALSAALHRAEPENRPMTLEDLDEMTCKDDWEFVWLEYQRVPSFLTQGCPYYVNEVHVWLLTPGTDDEFSYPTNDYNKTWRCWPRKPTPEQMAAAEWEE